MAQEAPIGVVLVGGPDGAERVLDGAGLALLGRADPGDAAALIARVRPDVVVVDLGVDPDAGEIGTLSAQQPDVPVLALGASDDHGEVLAAVRAGAAGYVVRGTGPADLVAAVRRTAEGHAVFSPGLADVVLESYGRPAAAGPARLTDREADVLRLVVDGLTARQIASRLVLSPRTVENHVQHILRKLELGNRAALVRYAIENGLA